MGDAESALRIGDAVIATSSLIPGVSWFVAGLAATEKGFEGQIAGLSGPLAVKYWALTGREHSTLQ
jgi:hypothetical protein